MVRLIKFKGNLIHQYLIPLKVVFCDVYFSGEIYSKKYLNSVFKVSALSIIEVK